MSFRSTFHAHKPLFYVTLALAVFVMLELTQIEITYAQFFSVVVVNLIYVAIAFVTMACLIFSYLFSAIKEHIKSPVKAPLGDIAKRVEQKIADYIAAGRLTDALWATLIIQVMMIFFCLGKSLLTVLVPFYADPFLAQGDHWLHGGVYPHQLLLPLVDTYQLMPLVDVVYLVWFLVMGTAGGYSIFCDNDRVRRLRYLLSFALSWTLCGTLLALVLSSCGPMYYHFYYSGVPQAYTDLLLWLQTANDGKPVMALETADWLRSMISDDILPDISGISAFPSQHVAISWLIGLYAWANNRLLGAVVLVYALLVLCGSVLLAWHYALDGYVSILASTLIWWVSGKIVNRFMNNKTDGNQPASA